MTTTNRSTPNGTRMDDGYQTLIAFNADSDIEFWEKTVQPPGFDGGDPIDTTTMHNTTWRTMAARALKTLTPFSVSAAYDPQILDTIVTLINNEDWISIHFPDGSTWDFYGFLQTFEPGDMVEGEQPEASITVVPTNTHPTTRAEVAPDYSATGTAA